MYRTEYGAVIAPQWWRSALRWLRLNGLDLLAEIPWGVIAFFIVLGFVLAGRLKGDLVTGLGSAAGLLGVGHGIHAGAKRLASGKQPAPPAASTEGPESR